MDKQNDFIGDCPLVVSNQIDKTLNNLPNRKKQIIQFNFVNTIAASVAALLLLFIVTWTINPVMASGNTFRDVLFAMINDSTTAQEIIEPPLPAPDIAEAENEIIPEETAALIISDEQGIEIPAVIVDGYEFRLEDQIIYDGAQLTIAYNVRKADGSPMPSVEEFTKVHMAGFIRMRELLMGDVSLEYVGEYIYDWDDPYMYRQVMTFNMRDVSSGITDETEFILSIGIYDYGEKATDTIEHFAYLPFCVNTSHNEFAASFVLEQSLFDTGEFIVEVMPLIESVTGTQIEIRTYKPDDAGWGKRVNEDIFVRIEKLDGTSLGISGSFGFGVADDGTTYIETIYELAADEKLPQQLKIYFSCGDSNSGEQVSYEPIIITFE